MALIALIPFVLIWPQLATAQASIPTFSLGWSSSEDDDTLSVAWGDYDNDGDLDLAVGNGGITLFGQVVGEPNRLYCNSGGALTLCWSSNEEEFTTSLSWGDYDNDGDLDLVVGNGGLAVGGVPGGEHNRLYRNDGLAEDGITPIFSPVWLSNEADATMSVAWGDYDNDGDLDLAVGNGTSTITGQTVGQPNRLYCNNNGLLSDTWCWSSNEADATASLAWGDVNGDGQLDLAVGNDGPNRLYCNDGLRLTQSSWCWSSDEADTTLSVAWGDVDSDGDLDLAVGNGNLSVGQPNRLYCNDGLMLAAGACWSSEETDTTLSVAWGDWDNDGHLDLAAGNGNSATQQPNRLYCNDGVMLVAEECWSSGQSDGSPSVAWGDVDGDGSLDLAVGNAAFVTGQPNRLYHNDAEAALMASPVWSALDASNAYSLAWGDVDSDSDLDLVAGNSGPNRLYRNDDGGWYPLTWYPTWPDAPDPENRDCDCLSSSYVGAPILAVQTQTVSLAIIQARGSVAIVQQPDQGNNYTLMVEFDDGGTSGADWYQVNLSYMTDPALDSTLNVRAYIDGLSYLIVQGEAVYWRHLELAAPGRLAGANKPTYLSRGPTIRPIWSSNETGSTSSVAWGDVDGDGDLDLAVGNSDIAPTQLYRNDNGLLTASPVWSATEIVANRSLAWGDVDGDGDLDLAIGNDGQSNRLYRNDGIAGDGTLIFSPVWSSTKSAATYSLAWGDVDSDGDLDLAVGNINQPNQLYRNNGGLLTASPVWSSTEEASTRSVAWGDVDGDGDLDLAAGDTGQPTRLYCNNDGKLTDSACWSSNEVDQTWSVAWGDVDGDGDLDLAVGSDGLNRLYRNNCGSLTKSAVWSSVGPDDAWGIAWGDVDGDGDLDLAAGNRDAISVRVYHNLRRRGTPLANNPPYVTIPRPGATAGAAFFSTPHIIQGANGVSIPYTLFDPEGDIVPKIFPEFSPNGGGQWFSATPAGADTNNLAASPWPTGTTHTFVWDAQADLIRSDNVVFRLRAQPNYSHSPILWPALGAQSFSFRVEAAEWYVKVVDGGGQAIEGAPVYYEGQLAATPVNTSGLTNKAGLLRLDNPTPGQPLAALAQTKEQTTTRAAHDGWAYRTYITNLDLDSSGVPSPTLVGQPGPQLVTVRPDDPLILFNIVASVEWDATLDYLEMLEDAFAKASEYLYDVTDGQMAFGRVKIYDQAQHWSNADFQFSAKNTVRPYAFHGGLTSSDEAHTIRVGRFWDGGSGSRGNWNQPYGYRTLVHEFGHYALYLYDEYFLRLPDLSGEVDAYCTGPEVGPPSPGVDPDPHPEQPGNASLMFYQYKASELADKTYNWDANCEYTEQYRLNNGQSDWETVLRYYDDSGGAWTLNTPALRGSVMAGPDQFPTELLPFPEVTVHDSGLAGGPSLQLTVLDPQSRPVHNALVALYTTGEQGTIAIDQGLTDRQGQIEAYGATPGDQLRAATFDGALSGAVAIGSDTEYELILFQVGGSGLSGQVGGQTPYLSLTPQGDGDALYLQVAGLSAGGGPLDAFVAPAEGGGSPQSTSLAYSSGEGVYVGTVSLSGVGLGSGRVRVSGGSLPSAINSDYNLQPVQAITTNHLYSEDGNFELHIAPNVITAAGYATVAPTGYVPGPLPAGKQVAGSAYEVRLSGALTDLGTGGLVRLHYHPQVMGVYSDTLIYYWNPTNKVWQIQGGQPSEVDNAWSAPATSLGIYALLGVRIGGRFGDNSVYLPLIVK